MAEHYRRMKNGERIALLVKVRNLMGASQAAFASEMGMSLRAYSDVENGISKCRIVHVLSAERLALGWAALTVRPDMLDADELALLRSDVMDVACRRLGDRLLPADTVRGAA